MLGVFALIFGISSPGYGAEVFGVIAILLSLIGSGFSISELSLIFLGIGAVLLFIEFFVTPGFGVIGVGGVICFIVGSIFSKDYMNTLIQVRIRVFYFRIHITKQPLTLATI